MGAAATHNSGYVLKGNLQKRSWALQIFMKTYTCRNSGRVGSMPSAIAFPRNPN
jgi:hypothetical protein